MERKGSKKVLNILGSVFGILPKKVLNKLQRKIVVVKSDKCDYIASMFSSNYDSGRLYFKKSDFDKLIEIPFETVTVYAPENWEDFLKRLYKDYMKLPPEGKRNSGHDVYKISL